MFQNLPNPNQIDKYFAHNRIDKHDDIDTIIHKMLMNARDDSMVIKILEFRRKYEESIRKGMATIKQEDVNEVIKKFTTLALKYIPKESQESFIDAMENLAAK
jgi:hypothetical protein